MKYILNTQCIKNIIAINQYEACKKFIRDVGFHLNPVIVEGGGFMSSPKHFDESTVREIFLTIERESERGQQKILQNRKQSAEKLSKLLIEAEVRPF